VVQGRDAVVRGTLGGVRRIDPRARLEYADVNGWPGVLLWVGERLEGIVSIECDDEQIHAVYLVMNPDKLGAVERSRARRVEKLRVNP
jgi:RNA polymerase sigma-70 factor (ECF subfamily)